MNTMHAYIDGFNLYMGMMDHRNNMPGATYPPPVLRRFLWLDLNEYVSSFFNKRYTLARIHYFTAPVRDNPDSLARQETYWKALESITYLKIHKGVNARRFDDLGNVVGYEEKQSDVRLALQAYDDALHIPEINAMTFVCADSDQVPTIERIQNIRSDIKLFLIYPPCRRCGDLEKLIPRPFITNYIPLRDNQFPEKVEYEKNGRLIQVVRPDDWK